MEEDRKRLFFALEVQAPWPQPMPAGRRLDEMHRHMTVAFLGVVDYGILQPALAEIPKLPFQIGLTGIFDQCLFLPERHPRRRGLACRLAGRERAARRLSAATDLLAAAEGIQPRRTKRIPSPCDA